MYKLERDSDIKRLSPSITVSNGCALIDELMAPIIQLLNIKGWKTTDCCSGHLICQTVDGLNDDKDMCYIKFDTDLQSLKTHGFIVPSYFNVVENPSYTIIYRKFHHDMDRYEQILDANRSLYLWSRCLNPYVSENHHESE